MVKLSTVSIIKELAKNNFSVWISGEDLELSFGDDAPSPSLIQKLKAYRSELVAFLKERKVVSQDAFNNLLELNQFPLSFAQERLLFIERFEGGTDAYHMPHLYRLNDDINFKALEAAFKVVVDRHTILKTVYRNDDGNDFQVVWNADIAWEYHTIPVKDDLFELVDREMARPFNLAMEPSIRLQRYTVKDEHFLFMLWHHIAFDGWSSAIFMEELSIAYNAKCNGIEPDLPKLEISYADYAVWQREHLNGSKLDSLLDYWKTQLTGYESLHLPLDFIRPNRLDYKGDDLPFELSETLSQQLRELARDQETTLYTVLLAAFYITLANRSGQTDILIGMPSDNRPHAQTLSLIGFFINSLPLRAQVKGDQSIEALIRHVHEVVTGAKIHQELPIEKLVDVLKVERDASRHPLFQVIFSLQGFDGGNYEYPLPFESVELPSRSALNAPARYELSLLLSDGEKKIEGFINYATSLYSRESVKQVGNIFRKVLEAFVKNKKQKIVNIDLFPNEDRALALDAWNQTEADYPMDKTIQQLFEEQVEQTPNKVAVVHEDKELTYAQLNEKANQLAHTIRNQYKEQQGQELTPDTFVALYLHRSLDMVVSILAVLKAGAAYVPISPSYPKTRTSFILEDTKAALLLVQHDEMTNMIMDGWLMDMPHAPNLLLVDDGTALATQPSTNLASFNAPTDLAYIIYTSGTTGQPKGVMVEHQGVASFAKNNTYIAETPNKIASFAPYSFDGFVFDAFYSLLNGVSVYLMDKSFSLDPEGLCKYLSEQEVDAFFTTTALFNQLVNCGGLKTTKVRQILFGGEKADLASIQKGIADLEAVRFIHVYGPTETVVYASAYHFDGTRPDRAPIGGPLTNKSFYVLDEKGDLVPIGSPGELYIGGAGMARGYLNRPTLTEERFVSNPFASAADLEKGYDRMYKTGDVVRWLSCGNLEFIGRVDTQVKIRGHRIELQEIESILKTLNGVKDAVVIDREKEAGKYIAAYLVSNTGEALDLAKVRTELAELLPDYMVPNTFTELDLIPLNINGKLDRKALPDPEFASDNSFVKPTNAIEQKLADIWQEVLGKEEIGIHDNFFHIGGDSIVAIRVISKSKALGLSFSVMDLFSKPTIAKLATGVKVVDQTEAEYEPFSLLTDDQKNRLEALYPQNLADAFPATQLQMGMLLASKLEKGTYHDVINYPINTAFDADRFTSLLNQLVNRHEVLRTGFIEDDEDGYVAFVVKEMAAPYTKMADVLDEEVLIEQEHYESFDFSVPGLYRFLVSNVTDDSFLFTFSLHHAIVDGWSEASLIAQLLEAYISGADQIGSNTTLPKYGEFVRNERLALSNEQFEKFWSNYLADYEPPVVPLVREASSSKAGIEEPQFCLTSEESARIIELASELDVTIDSIFLAVYHHVLSLFQDTNDFMIGLVVNNRLEKEGGDELAGLFLNTIPFRPSATTQNVDAAAWLKHIAAEKMKVMEYKALPYAHIKSKWLLEANDYQCVFNYTHFHNKDKASEFSDQNNETIIGDRTGIGRTDIPFSLSVLRRTDDFEVILLVNQDSIDELALQQVWSYYKASIHQLVNKEVELSSNPLPRLIEKDLENLNLWNKTDVPFSKEKTIQTLFEEQVNKTPDSLALVFNEQRLTYNELNQSANQMAHTIRNKYREIHDCEIKADTLIPIYLDRSLNMIVSILAVLKAGAAYVPVSPNFPEERVAFLLEDTKSTLLISEQKYGQRLSKWLESSAATVEVLLADNAEHFSSEDTANPASISLANNLAYVIYTSGTTGQPKGVMIEHQSVANLINFIEEAHQLEVGVKTLFFSDYVFDASVIQLFPCLVTGSPIIIASDKDRESSDALMNLIEKNQITKAFVPTAWMDHLAKKLQNSGVKVVNTGGEKLNPLSYLPAEITYNEYGPTEATVMVTAKLMKDKTDVGIGKPIDNTRLYVVNRNGDLVPPCCPGELYIGGAVLARAYLNRPDLSAQSFIENPFATEVDKELGYNRLYKTGDLVCWLPDGSLEFLGRKDGQVKVRGYRIELGEVETAIRSLSEVDQVVVIDRKKEGQQFLAAYIVPHEECSVDRIREKLYDLLPEYMVPSTFTTLESIPLTISGKLDRKALPEPAFVSGANYVAPRNEMEAKLCAVWEEVLGLDRVGIHDNFFYIGGSSIAAIRLTSVGRRELGMDIPIALLFKYKTIADLAPQLETQTIVEIPKTDLDQYPLSFAQERLLFIERFEEGSTAYHMPYLVELTSDVNLDALTEAFNIVVNRHPVLKTIYLQDEAGVDYQDVLVDPISMINHKILDKDHLLAMVEQAIAQPFNLSSEVSIRLHHYVSDSKQYLLVLWHHIAFDGWSTDLFLKELSTAYVALSNNANPELPALDISYRDYSVWQREQLEGDNLSDLLNYWKQNLSAYETLDLPTDHLRPSQLDFRGKDFAFELDADLSQALRELAKKQESTLYTVLLSGFYVTLASLTGQTDLIVGTPSDNRAHPQTQSLIGFFVNALALRTELKPSDSISDLIGQVHEVITQAKVHQELPFEKLIDLLQVERDPSRHPLCQVMFSVHDFINEEMVGLDLPFKMMNLTEEQSVYSPAKHDLTLALTNRADQIVGVLNYAISLFEETTIERVAKIYEKVLRAFVSDKKQPIADIDLLSIEDRKQLLEGWEKFDVPFSANETIFGRFEEQAARTPDGIALVFENEQLTYAELNKKANRMAHIIRAKYRRQHQEALPVDTLIPIYLERSIDMVVGILAILKAGGAYVPVSPDYPEERLAYMLKDTGASLMVTQEKYLDQLGNWFLRLSEEPILILTGDQETNEETPSINPEPISTAKDLAYVIYTSGTTGQPKGVMVEHRSVANMNQFISKTHLLNEGVKALFFSDYVFDASVFELFPCLTSGATIVIASDEDRTDSTALLDLINRHQIEKAFIPTALLNQLAEELKNSSLKVIHTGGERLNNLSELPAEITFNQYGPTEGTVLVTQNQLGDENDIGIGEPIDNARLYVVDRDGKLVPPGSPGELYIGGAILARGYLNRIELTREKFIENPFATADDLNKGYTRLYKTGDLVRWLPDGCLAFLGRVDKQVKIRGHRIELGEIENVLLAFNEVEQVVVIDRERDGNKFLAAYIVPAENYNFDDHTLRVKLAEKLPSYMVPSTFTELEWIPRTINDKLDWRALPEPEFVSNENYVAPESEMETLLCNIWQEVLGLEKVGIHDNFFFIGGDSIISIQLVSKLRKEGISLQVKSIFKAPTVAQLAQLLLTSNHVDEVETEQGILEGTFDLLPIQDWFFEQPLAKANHWNQAFTLCIPGDIAIEKIEKALKALADQHDMLRANFIKTEDGFQQAYHTESSTWVKPLESYDVSKLNEEERHQLLTKVQSDFDYLNGPLWCATYLTGYDDQDARLVFAFHHLIIDVVSWRIIAEDMRALLMGEMLSEKRSSYRQWASTIRNYAVENASEEKYWTAVTEGLKINKQFNSPCYQSIQLSKEETKILLQEANHGYHTEINDLLLSALAICMKNCFGKSTNHITLEGHGREAINSKIDITQTVGWFTTTFPVKLVSDDDVGKTIVETKEMLRAIPNKGIGYGALCQIEKLKRTLPNIAFNYLGQLDNQSSKTTKQHWQIIDEDSGLMIATENVDELLVNVTGLIQNGQLQFNIATKLTEKTTQHFADQLKRALILVIEKGQEMAQQGGVKTPSDYKVQGVSVEYLSRLQEKFDASNKKENRDNIIEI